MALMMFAPKAFSAKFQPKVPLPTKPECRTNKLLSKSASVPSISERKLPFHEIKVRRKQAQKKLALTVATIATNRPSKKHKMVLQRSYYQDSRKHKIDMKTEYQIAKDGYDYSYYLYDPTKFPDWCRDDRNWSRALGPMGGRHKLKKYKFFPQHPIARFLKGKGRKYYDIEHEDKMEAVKYYTN
mmetsp:Transcript_32828/g.57355  ORF Transcript_32828/g.57355 Transcript_32828/m.57355 type:complete len:184 (+) Transcript_32828:2523-3074(+)